MTMKKKTFLKENTFFHTTDERFHKTIDFRKTVRHTISSINNNNNTLMRSHIGVHTISLVLYAYIIGNPNAIKESIRHN